jgi:hypothetical protein
LFLPSTSSSPSSPSSSSPGHESTLFTHTTLPPRTILAPRPGLRGRGDGLLLRLPSPSPSYPYPVPLLKEDTNDLPTRNPPLPTRNLSSQHFYTVWMRRLQHVSMLLRQAAPTRCASWFYATPLHRHTWPPASWTASFAAQQPLLGL